MIQRYSVYVLLLAVAVSLSSCRRAVEKARRNIRAFGADVVVGFGRSSCARRSKCPAVRRTASGPCGS